MTTKQKTNREVRETLEHFADIDILGTDSNADTMARYALSQLYSMIEHVITIDIKFPNNTTAFDADYILKRFKELAKMWARAQLDAPEVGSEITVNIQNTEVNHEAD